MYFTQENRCVLVVYGPHPCSYIQPCPPPGAWPGTYWLVDSNTTRCGMTFQIDGQGCQQLWTEMHCWASVLRGFCLEEDLAGDCFSPHVSHAQIPLVALWAVFSDREGKGGHKTCKIRFPMPTAQIKKDLGQKPATVSPVAGMILTTACILFI